MFWGKFYWLMKYKCMGTHEAEGEEAQGSMKRALGGEAPFSLTRLFLSWGPCPQLCSESLGPDDHQFLPAVALSESSG